MAPRIKHIALHTEDPVATAEWYKTCFGLDELRRSPDGGAEGVWLTDGYIYFAILKMGTEDAPNLGEGPSTVKGVHHIGFYVDDLEEAVRYRGRARRHRVPRQQPRQPQVQGPRRPDDRPARPRLGRANPRPQHAVRAGRSPAARARPSARRRLGSWPRRKSDRDSQDSQMLRSIRSCESRL